MSKEIEKLVSPALRMTLLQHFRSFLNISELKAEEIEKIDFFGISVTAFATKYEFNIHYRHFDDGVVKSALFDLGGVAKTETKVVDRWYTGSISEILEPGDSYPRFEEHFNLIEDSSAIPVDEKFSLNEDVKSLPVIKE